MTPVGPLHKDAVRILRQNTHFSLLLLFLPQADINVSKGWHLLHDFDHIVLLQLLPVLLCHQIVQPACSGTPDSIVGACLEQLDQRVDQPGFPRFRFVLIVIGRQVAQSRGGQALRLFRANMSVCSARGGTSANRLSMLLSLCHGDNRRRYHYICLVSTHRGIIFIQQLDQHRDDVERGYLVLGFLVPRKHLAQAPTYLPAYERFRRCELTCSSRSALNHNPVVLANVHAPYRARSTVP